MVKDYARTTSYHRKHHRGFAIFMSCILLVLLLLVLWGGYSFVEHHKFEKVRAPSKVKQIEIKGSDVKQKGKGRKNNKRVVNEIKNSSNKDSLQYDFYTLLPKLKVSSGVVKSSVRN